MAVCPSCRQNAPIHGRLCPYCGLELPGRTRLGISFPPSGKLGHTLLGPTTEEAGLAVETTRTPSESPVGRRFEASGDDTWFGHEPRTSAEPPEAPTPPPVARPEAVTRASRSAEEAWFRVRGPSRSPARPVRANEQRSPWPKLRLFGRELSPIGLGASIFAAGLGGALAAHLVPGPPALEVIGFEVTPDGKDLLTVSCRACKDGSTLRLADARASFVGGVARLESQGLEVGDNQLPLELQSPDGQVARIEVAVALAFRVSTDLRGITEVPPYALVVVAAPRGTSVTIGGSPAPSDPGVVRARVELDKDARGPEARPVEIHRKIPVRVLGPGLERSTHATIAATVVPLVLAAAPTVQAGQWRVTGRTSPGAAVELTRGGQRLAEGAADAGGHFTLTAAAAGPGPAQLSARAPGRISRQLDCPLLPPP